MKDKYVCIETGFFPKCSCGKMVKNPKINDIVTVIDLENMFYPAFFILKEFGHCSCGSEFAYKQTCFRPLDEVLSEISLKEVEEVLERELVEV